MQSPSLTVPSEAVPAQAAPGEAVRPDARALRVPAIDDYPLRAYLYASHGAADDEARASIVIGPAMGVAQRFYADFARYLAGHGYMVYTFDYRGMGEDAPPTLRGFAASATDWAQRDYNAMVRHAKATHPDVPLYLIGHSLGGQLPGLLPDHALVDGLITVGAGSGYWRDNVPRLKRIVWIMWYLLVPTLMPVFGYWPGARLRMIGNLPRAVMLEWRRWCLHPEYICDEQGRRLDAYFPAIRFPILSVSFTDDEYLSERNIRSLHDRYTHAAVEMQRVAPLEAGVKRIGHFGFFRNSFASSLWPRVLRWLEDQTTTHPPR